MADGIYPSLVSKDRNANIVTNPIFVTVSDGTAAVNFTGTSMDVNVTNASIAVTATDLDIRDLVQGAGNDNVTVWANTAKDGTGTDYIPLVDTDGHLQIDVLTLPALSFDTSYVDDSAFTIATDNVGAVGMLADETAPDSVDEGDIGIPRMTLDRKQLMVLADATTDSQRLAIDSSGNAQVDLAAVSVTAVPVSKDSSANSETNPIYVQNVTTAVSGAEVHDYDVAVGIASDSSSNHDYAVANTTFLLKSVILAGSGNIKAEVQVGPVASLVTKAVIFLNDRQGDTRQVFFDPAIEVPATGTGTVRVIKTNRQGAATDLYSTIIGSDV